MVLVYFIGMLAMGFYIGRKQKNVEDYFVAGRSMPWFVVGISIIASLLSTISYLSVPGEMIKNGVGVLAGLLCAPFVFLVVGYLLIPFFMRLRMISAYEFLEDRFDLPTRLFGTTLFILIRLSWMSMIVFTAARAMEEITNIEFEHLVMGLGIIAIVYTTLGGIRAVIWTDLIQFVILFGGAIYTICHIAIDTGTGPGIWWEHATTIKRTPQPIWSWDPYVRVTLIGVIINSFFWWVCTAGSDQVAIQRFLSTKSTAAARRSFGTNLCAQVVLMFCLGLCGIALFSYWHVHQLPAIDPDSAFPTFIAEHIPKGVAGLIVAALLSAAMSSLDSGMNSTSTVVTVDFVRRLRNKALSPSRELLLARFITVLVGIVAVALCIALKNIPADRRGNITDMTSQISSYLVGGLGGLFLIAVLLPRCRGTVVIFSSVVGIAIGSYMGMGHYFTQPKFHVTVIEGPHAKLQRFDLSHETPTIIGSDQSATIVLPGTAVEPRHCEIRWSDDPTGPAHWVIVNLGEPDQLKIKDETVMTSMLESGHDIVIGPYKLVFLMKVISWMWIIPVSCLVPVVVAAATSFVLKLLFVIRCKISS